MTTSEYLEEECENARDALFVIVLNRMHECDDLTKEEIEAITTWSVLNKLCGYQPAKDE